MSWSFPEVLRVAESSYGLLLTQDLTNLGTMKSLGDDTTRPGHEAKTGEILRASLRSVVAISLEGITALYSQLAGVIAQDRAEARAAVLGFGSTVK